MYLPPQSMPIENGKTRRSLRDPLKAAAPAEAPSASSMQTESDANASIVFNFGLLNATAIAKASQVVTPSCSWRVEEQPSHHGLQVPDETARARKRR